MTSMQCVRQSNQRQAMCWVRVRSSSATPHAPFAASRPLLLLSSLVFLLLTHPTRSRLTSRASMPCQTIPMCVLGDAGMCIAARPTPFSRCVVRRGPRKKKGGVCLSSIAPHALHTAKAHLPLHTQLS